MTAELEGELADPNERAVLRDAHEVQPLNDLGSVREVPAHREEKIRRELAVGIDDHVGVDARSFRVELVDEPVHCRALSAPVGIVSLGHPRALAVRLALAVSVTVTLSLGGVTRVTEKLWAPPSPAVKV